MMTAPTNEEAEAERTRGIIAPSTHVVGTPVATEPLEQLEDLDDPDVSNGEGGLDEALFQAMQGGSITEFFEAEPTVDACRKAAEAEWEELEEAEEDVEERHTAEQQEMLANMYGKGLKLLKIAGGTDKEICSRELPDAGITRVGRDRRGLGAGEESSTDHGKYARLNVEVAEEISELIRQHVKRVHNDRVGHMGKLRTYKRLRQLPGFPWGQPTESLHAGIKEWCEGCLTCQKIWSLRGRPGRPNGAIIRQRPFTEISIDLVVLTHEDRDGNKYILNVMDSFSRFSELFPLKVGDAESVAEALFAVYNRYGRPRVLRADGAKAFHGSVLKSLNRMLGVENHVTLAYSPYQNGQNERQNQEIGRHLRALVLGDVLGTNSRNRWGILCSAAQRILNNTVHGDLMATPNELLLGGYGDSDLAMFQEDPAVGEGEEVVAGAYARE